MGRDPAGWKGAARLSGSPVGFSAHWRSADHHPLVSLDARDASLLSSIDLVGLCVSLVIGPSAEAEHFLRPDAAFKSSVLPPLALIRLGGMLSAHGARVAIRDFFADAVFSRPERAALSDIGRLQARVAGRPDPEVDGLIARLVRSVLGDSPAVVGLSAATEQADPLVFLLFQRALRRIAPECRVVVGGRCAASGLDDGRLDEFDFFVEGEGEVPLLLICSSLVQGWDPARIPGLRGTSRPGLGPLRSELSHNLDVLPPPDLDALDLSLYDYRVYTGWRGTTAPYQFVSGCPCDCAYCNLEIKRRYKVRSAALVVRDLERLQDTYGIKQFFFLNSAFNVDRGYTESLLQAMLRRKRSWRWSDCGRPAPLGEDQLQRLRRAGCEWLNWGLDTASRRLDALYRRGLDRDAFAQLLRACRKAGIRNAVNVIVGLPHESAGDLTELGVFLRRHGGWIDRLFVYEYQFIPYSGIGRDPRRYGLRLTEDGRGVDEIGGLSWTRRREWAAQAGSEIRGLALEINRRARAV